ncbi:hypothetical protein EB796_018251 [Bugula neritina]|uniref:Uncharacterized protein n=1 Tax=Bugula neritina TaxID=10212 RepID=A0A7J7JB06_BUGNE|nr:hypothetical protein EB796_018251 [Bugula neritina]
MRSFFDVIWHFIVPKHVKSVCPGLYNFSLVEISFPETGCGPHTLRDAPVSNLNLILYPLCLLMLTLRLRIYGVNVMCLF